MSHHTCPFGQYNNLQPYQPSNSSPPGLLPPQSRTPSSFIRIHLNFRPFLTFSILVPSIYGSFWIIKLKKNWSTKCNLICTAYANSKNLTRRDEEFAAINFQSKRFERNRPQPAENVTAPLFVRRPALRISTSRLCSSAIQTFDFVSIRLSADKNIKTQDAAKQHLHEF